MMKNLIAVFSFALQMYATATSMEATSSKNCSTFYKDYVTEDRDTFPSVSICEKASVISSKLSTEHIMISAQVGCFRESYKVYKNTTRVQVIGGLRQPFPLNDIEFTSNNGTSASDQCEVALMYLSAISFGEIFFKAECKEDIHTDTVTLSSSLRIPDCM